MKKLILSCTLLVIILALCLPTVAHAENQTVSVGCPVEEYPELFRTRSMPTHGEGKIAVFLIEFPDHQNENPAATVEYYDKIYFSGGSFQSVWGDTTVADFYREQSYGKLNLSGRVFDWYTAKHERSYYNNKKAELVMEAAEYYTSQGVSFSDFDGNGDGVIDAIAYHFAGKASTARNDPWYGGLNYASGSGGFGKIGDVKFTTIIQVKEQADLKSNFFVGTICHELMHSFGMPDLYGEVNFGMKAAIDLMSTNVQTINPYTKMLLGWIDTVDVITSDAKGVKLLPYGTDKNGKVVIVTDQFNGLFDEFYIVAYRDYGYNTAVIWHIDARLNETESAFINNNLRYDPRPDLQNGHNTGKTSEHLFIEELSADPKFEFVLGGSAGGASSTKDTAFKENSVFGPDSLPSSDTHDGKYTGIRINNFSQAKNEEYLTFDISFIKDSTPPVITTKADSLEFKETIKIEFNEYIYEGENWESITATDINGNPLNIKLLRPHYPLNTIEIAFDGDAHKKGYNIIFPEGSVRDSSGNGVEAVTITVSADRLFLPVREEQLPSSGEYLRGNTTTEAHFFSYKDSVVIITTLWENHVNKAKLEFMRLDLNGKVLTQSIIDNPFKGGNITSSVTETSDGSYVFICNDSEKANYFDLMFCIDKNGALKWTNDDYHGSGKAFSTTNHLKLKNGIILSIRTAYSKDKNEIDIIYVDQQSGKIQLLQNELSEFLLSNSIHYLTDGKMLCTKSFGNSSGGHIALKIVDIESLDVLVEGDIPVTIDTTRKIEYMQVNDDGTMMLYCLRKYGVDVFLLDSRLNVIKSISRDTVRYTTTAYFSWFENDGFCYCDMTELVSHNNNIYRVFRYDRHLELVWETDVVANFVYYFKSPSSEIMSYKSMLSPERECYIENYGSESSRKNEHIHNLVHQEKLPATCLVDGCDEYWYCPDCGCYYSDEGQTVIANLTEIIIPKTEHSEKIIPAVEPKCTEGGTTEGTMCSNCNKIIVAPKNIPPLGEHSYGKWIVTREPTDKADGIKSSTCTVCGDIKNRPIEKLSVDEPSVDEPSVDEPDSPSSSAGCAGAMDTDRIIIIILISAFAIALFRRKKHLNHSKRIT